MPRRTPLIVLVLSLALSGVACSAVSEAAAIVNGQKITQGEFEEEEVRLRDDPQFLAILRQAGDATQARGAYRRDLLTARIRQIVIRQAAEDMGISVTDADVDRFLQDLTAQLGGEAAFQDLLRQANLTPERARVLAERLVYEQEVREQVTEDLEVSDEDIQSVYEQNQAEFEEVHLLRMTLPTVEEAQQMLDRLSQGALFSELAGEHSTDEAAEAGGDVGFVPVSRLGGQLRAQLETVPDGGFVGPVQGQGGVEIYQVLERRTQPLSEVRERITEGLLQQDRRTAFEDWLAEQLQEADIVVNPKYGRFDPEAMRIVPSEGGLPE